jgi:hypothetical protein
MGLRYVLQLLFSEKFLKNVNNLTITKAREKNNHIFGILLNLEKF